MSSDKSSLDTINDMIRNRIKLIDRVNRLEKPISQDECVQFLIREIGEFEKLRNLLEKEST